MRSGLICSIAFTQLGRLVLEQPWFPAVSPNCNYDCVNDGDGSDGDGGDGGGLIAPFYFSVGQEDLFRAYISLTLHNYIIDFDTCGHLMLCLSLVPVCVSF